MDESNLNNVRELDPGLCAFAALREPV